MSESVILEELVLKLSNHFSRIIPRDELREHKKLDWGDNGIGDRWANKKFNYTSISKSKNKTYSENDDEDNVPVELLEPFLEANKNNKGILGIFFEYFSGFFFIPYKSIFFSGQKIINYF